jgi:hypothetical protein
MGLFSVLNHYQRCPGFVDAEAWLRCEAQTHEGCRHSITEGERLDLRRANSAFARSRL